MNTASKKQKKVKFWVLIIVVVLSITLAMTLLYFMALKPTYNEAIVLYKNAFSDYNRVVSEYSTKVEQINQENEKLKSAINSLQEIVSFGEKPYDPDTITNANAAINKGKIATITIPKWEDKALKVPTDFNIFQTKSIKQAVEKTKDYSSSLTTIVGLMKIPDYSEVLSTIDEAKNVLEKSIKQMKQVTCPNESFVLERITNIQEQAGIIDIISLTEDNDPENYIGKAGWYTVKVVFRHKDVEHYGLENGLLTLSEVGNPAGGCIEVYRTEKDAERRANELKAQEGTVRSPGARVICGTVVVRASDDLKTSYQQNLLTLIAEELLRLENNSEPSTETIPQVTIPPESTPNEIETSVPETTSNAPETTNTPTYIVPEKIYFTGGVCSYLVSFGNGVPPDNKTEFLDGEEVCFTGRFSGFSREYSVTFIGTFPNGEQTIDKFKAISNDVIGYGWSDCGIGAGNFKVILDSTGEILGYYEFIIHENKPSPALDPNEYAKSLFNEGHNREEIIQNFINSGMDRSTAEKTVDTCGIDWNTEALKIVKKIITDVPPSQTCYSPNDLKTPYEMRVFSDSQKEYAINNSGIDWNTEVIDVINMLDLNLKFMNWEKYADRLVKKDEMIYELINRGFTEAQAIYGVNNCNIDWIERE